MRYELKREDSREYVGTFINVNGTLEKWRHLLLNNRGYVNTYKWVFENNVSPDELTEETLEKYLEIKELLKDEKYLKLTDHRLVHLNGRKFIEVSETTIKTDVLLKALHSVYFVKGRIVLSPIVKELEKAIGDITKLEQLRKREDSHILNFDFLINNTETTKDEIRVVEAEEGYYRNKNGVVTHKSELRSNFKIDISFPTYSWDGYYDDSKVENYSLEYAKKTIKDNYAGNVSDVKVIEELTSNDHVDTESDEVWTFTPVSNIDFIDDCCIKMRYSEQPKNILVLDTSYYYETSKIIHSNTKEYCYHVKREHYIVPKGKTLKELFSKDMTSLEKMVYGEDDTELLVNFGNKVEKQYYTKANSEDRLFVFDNKGKLVETYFDEDRDNRGAVNEHLESVNTNFKYKIEPIYIHEGKKYKMIKPSDFHKHVN